MHSEPVTHDNVDPFNAITERPVPVLMERRCPTSNPGSSRPGKAAEPNRLRKGGGGGNCRFTASGLQSWTWRTEQRDVTEPLQEAAPVQPQRVKPSRRPRDEANGRKPSCRRWLKIRDGESRDATAKLYHELKPNRN